MSRAVFGPTALDLPADIRVQFVEDGQTVVATVPLERYVEATILSEFAPAAGDVDSVQRMYQVQAIISRTYAVANLGRHASEGFDLCSTTHCQLYQPGRLQTSRWAPYAAEAVRQTAAGVLWYRGAPASALFHADCGGHTSSDGDVWGGLPHPYLAGVADDGPAAGAHASWRFDTTVAAAARALDADARTRVDGRFDGFDIVERDAAGRAERIAIRGREPRIVRGEELPSCRGRSATRDPEHQFEVKAADRLIFEGRGFGHASDSVTRVARSRAGWTSRRFSRSISARSQRVQVKARHGSASTLGNSHHLKTMGEGANSGPELKINSHSATPPPQRTSTPTTPRQAGRRALLRSCGSLWELGVGSWELGLICSPLQLAMQLTTFTPNLVLSSRWKRICPVSPTRSRNLVAIQHAETAACSLPKVVVTIPCPAVQLV